MSKRKSPALPAGFRGNALVELHYALQEHIPQVYNLMTRGDGDFRGLTFSVKDEGVVSVLKAYNGEGLPVVLFGSGYDALSALLGLEGAMAADRWKEDRPWTPGKGSDGK